MDTNSRFAITDVSVVDGTGGKPVVDHGRMLLLDSYQVRQKSRRGEQT